MKTKFILSFCLLLALTGCTKKMATDVHTFAIDSDAVENVSVFTSTGESVEGIMFQEGTYNIYTIEKDVYLDLTLLKTQSLNINGIDEVTLEPMDERNRTFDDVVLRPTISNEELLSLLNSESNTIEISFTFTPKTEEEKQQVLNEIATCWLSISLTK